MAKQRKPRRDPETFARVARMFNVSPDLVSRAEFIKGQSKHLALAVLQGLITIEEAESVIEKVEYLKRIES